MKHSFTRKLCSITVSTSIIVSLIVCSLLFLGCAEHKTAAVFTKPVTDYRAILYAPWNPTKKVCVLPFGNLGKESDAELKVMEIFLTELFSAGIFEDIVDPVQANAALGGLRIRKADSLDRETIKALGERLEAQYLILGTVTEYAYGKSKGSASEVGLSVRMIDADTGNILWTGNCNKDGNASLGRIFGFTDGPNPAELGQEACQQIIHSLKQQIKRSYQRQYSQKARQAEEEEKEASAEGEKELSAEGEKEPSAPIEDAVSKRR
ncbi:MAG: hypothetical protein ACMUIA_06890 [bacterium]